MARAAAKPGSFDLQTVKLEQYEPNRFWLLDKTLTFTDSEGDPHTVTNKMLERGTDLASVPSMLWWFVASYGRQTRAALLHDALVRRPDIIARSDADWVFRDALWASEVPVLRRGLMWTAVSLETTFLTRFGSRTISALIQLAQLATVIAALVYWYVGGELVSWRALLAAALIAGVAVSLKRAGAALLVDHVTLIVGTFWFWWSGERPTWQAALFAGAAASWLLWGRRSLWMLFGIVALVPAAALVWTVRFLVGLLEYVATPVSNTWRFLRWKLGSGDEGGGDEQFVRDRTEGAWSPTRKI